MDAEILAQLNPSQGERYRQWSQRRMRHLRGEDEAEGVK
jgi:hypothetical protein